MKITTFDRASVKFIREQIDAALDKIAAENGLSSIRTTTGSFESNEFSFKIEGVLDTNVKNEKSEQWAEMLGLPSDIIGKEVNLQGRLFTIINIDPSKPKNSVSIQRIPDGKRFKCPASMIKNALLLTKKG